MGVGLFQEWLRGLNDTAPALDAVTLRTQVDANVQALRRARAVWLETGIGTGSREDHILRSLRFVDAAELRENAEIYDRYAEALGINGAYALLASTYTGAAKVSVWQATIDRVWRAKLTAPLENERSAGSGD
jgi:hypothetical protein